MVNSTKKLVKNFLLLFAGNFVAKVLSFLMVPFYTAYLTTSEYGVSDLISTTVLLVLPFFSLLMDEAIMRFALDKGNDKNQVFTIASTLSTVGFLFFLLVSPILLLFESIREYYWFILLYYVSLWVFNICSNFVKGLDKVAIVMVAGIIHTIAYVGLNITFLACFKIGVIGYLLAINISNLIAAVFLIVYCALYKYVIRARLIDWKLAKDMLRYSVPMIPDYISWWVINCSDRYMLTYIVGTAATGLYSAAYKIPTILVSVNVIFSSAWRISSVENFGSQESVNFYNKIYANYNAFLFASSSVLILLTKPLSFILLSGDFFYAWEITPFLILAFIFSTQAIFVGSIFTASKRTKKLFIAPLVGSILNILLNIILIPYIGEIGAAIATCVGYLVVLLINIFNTRKLLPMEFRLLQNILLSFLILAECILVVQESDYTYLMCISIVIIIVSINSKRILPIILKQIKKYVKR